MAAEQSCPRASALEPLIAGTLSETEQAELATHLERCQICRTRFEQLTRQTGLLPDDLRQPGAAEPALARLIDRLDAEGPEATDAGGQSPDEHGLSLGFLAPSDNPEHLGRLGPYEITEVIGRGGMGIVLKGVDPQLRRVVAIKVLAPQLASDATARRRFAREARTAAAVSHDHVVAIHAVDDAEGLPFLVMECVAGVSLEARIKRSGPLQLNEILRIGMQTASGLAAAHARGLVHRDIKPSNILLENGVERVKITDFGLARAADDVRVTKTGIVSGTPEYMSPEQARGGLVDHRTDLFSLGCVLYAMCAGRPPFRAQTTLEAIRRVSEDTPRPLSEVNPEIPDWLAGIINKLLAKDRHDRFASAADLAELLEKCLAHVEQPTLIPRPPELDALLGDRHRSSDKKRSRRRRLGVFLAAVFLVLVVLAATEVTGVTQFVSTLIESWTRQDTRIVEVDGPGIDVTVDGASEGLSSGQWVDLLPLVDLQRDRVQGEWQREEEGLSIVIPGMGSCVMLPVELTGSYELEVEFTRHQGDDAVDFFFPVADTACMLGLSSHHGEVSGIELVDGRRIPESPVARRPGALVNGQRYALRVRVRAENDQEEDSQIEALLDGEPYLRWTGRQQSLSLYRMWGALNLRRIGLMAHGSRVTYHVARLRVVSGSASLIPAETASVEAESSGKAVPAGEWIDLSANVDLGRDSVHGEWQREADSLKLVKPDAFARLMLPVIVDGSYELEIEVTRNSGAEGIGAKLPVGDTGVSFVLGGWGGQVAGLELIDGRRATENATTQRPYKLSTGKRYKVLARVQPGGDDTRVEVSLYGKPTIQWSGSEASLSLPAPWRFLMESNRRPALTAHLSTFTFHSVRFRLISGDARLLPPARPTDDSREPATEAAPNP